MLHQTSLGQRRQSPPLPATPPQKHSTGRAWPTVAVLPLFLLSACASLDQHTNEVKERYLSAAGFRMFPATNAEQAASLKRMPQRELVRPRGSSQPTYLYADDEGCHCLYVGGETEWNEYHRLSGIKRNTDNALIAADMRDTFSISGASGVGGIGGFMW